MFASSYSSTGFVCKGYYFLILIYLIKVGEREGMGRVLVLNYDILKMLKLFILLF